MSSYRNFLKQLNLLGREELRQYIMDNFPEYTIDNSLEKTIITILKNLYKEEKL